MTIRPIYILLTVVCTMALIFLSGEATITIHHKPSFEKNTKNKAVCSKLYRVCDIQLTTTIDSPETYYDIAEYLRSTATPDYTIRLHLSGYGGQVKGMHFLKSTLDQTGATIVPIVEGNVYSAHAFLATSFGEVKVLGDYDMLFHTGSFYKESRKLCLNSFFRPMRKPYTNFSTGELVVPETREQYLEHAHKAIRIAGETDRGLLAFNKCVKVYDELSNNLHAKMVREFGGILTDEELKQFNNGEDVVISAIVIANRILDKEDK